MLHVPGLHIEASNDSGSGVRVGSWVVSRVNLRESAVFAELRAFAMDMSISYSQATVVPREIVHLRNG